MNALNIETAENGFVVYENDSLRQGVIGKKWAFESAVTLAEFVKNWGEGNTKTSTDKAQAV